MSFTLRVFFDGLIAFVVDKHSNPPATAYLVKQGHHYPFLLHASTQVGGSCTHDEAEALFRDLGLNDPRDEFMACRFSRTDFTEIGIESVGEELKFKDSGCSGCPSRTNRDWFCWVPRVRDVANEAISAKSETDLRSRSSAGVQLAEGHLKTFLFAEHRNQIPRLKAQVRGGLPKSPFSQAVAEISVLELPVSDTTVTIMVGGVALELRPRNSSTEVDVVIGNLPARDSMSSGDYAEHFGHFYDLGNPSPTNVHLPYREPVSSLCNGPAGEINPGHKPELIDALHPARDFSERAAYEPPICPQARF